MPLKRAEVIYKRYAIIPYGGIEDFVVVNAEESVPVEISLRFGKGTDYAIHQYTMVEVY